MQLVWEDSIEAVVEYAVAEIAIGAVVVVEAVVEFVIQALVGTLLAGVEDTKNPVRAFCAIYLQLSKSSGLQIP